MKTNCAALCLAAVVLAASRTFAAPPELPIYIEDNHAGSFYWLAQHLDLEQPFTLLHLDAHSDASGIFDSDKLRANLRQVASAEERQALLDQLRGGGAVQSFNWIEPLMPAPIANAIWVPGEKFSPAEIQERKKQATALLDGHLEAAPRQSGSFRDRYCVCALENLGAKLGHQFPLVVTIDLDYFSGIASAAKPAAFARVWQLVIEQPNLRAITFAISRPYLHDDAEADQLVALALNAALSLPTARIEFEPFLFMPNDRSARADELRKAGLPLPAYNITQAPEQLRARILAERNRISVQHNRSRWEDLLGKWEKEAPCLSLEVQGGQKSTDGIWRVPANEEVEIELVAEPWLLTRSQIEWFALTPKYPRCNVTDLSSSQVGFVADAAPRPVWNETRIAYSAATLPISQLDKYFEPRWHCGSLRLRARAIVDGRIRETPIIELRRFIGDQFRAAITEQFGLPYLFGSGELTSDANTGPETNLGADCANFIVFALRREGLRIPWSDPKGLRKHLDHVAPSMRPGQARFRSEDLQRGLIVDLGAHVAALVEDRFPFGVVDENDLVAHQLKGLPELLTLGELLRDRKKDSFDLLSASPAKSDTLLFGGDVMLGRSCARKIENGLDPFAGIRSLLGESSFAAANLECTISERGRPNDTARFSFRAPIGSAKVIAAAGFRAMGLANNHALDFGADGLSDCIANLSREKVKSVGVGETLDCAYAPQIFPLSGHNKLALLAIDDLGSKGNPMAELATASGRARLTAAINQAREQANFVVCLVHWGIENRSAVTDDQRALARWLVDHGVDAVVGSHPHCLQPLDFYRGRPIAYSLGNLVFDGAPTVPSWNHGALLEIAIANESRASSIRLIPVVLEDGLPQIRFTSEAAAFAPAPSGLRLSTAALPCSN